MELQEHPEVLVLQGSMVLQVNQEHRGLKGLQVLGGIRDSQDQLGPLVLKDQ